MGDDTMEAQAIVAEATGFVKFLRRWWRLACALGLVGGVGATVYSVSVRADPALVERVTQLEAGQHAMRQKQDAMAEKQQLNSNGIVNMGRDMSDIRGSMDRIATQMEAQGKLFAQALDRLDENGKNERVERKEADARTELRVRDLEQEVRQRRGGT